jgi:hypothetical protein
MCGKEASMKMRARGSMSAWLPLAAVVVFTIRSGPAAAQQLDTPPQPASSTGSVPNYQPLVPGLLARTRFSVAETSGRRVQLLDLLVGPGKRSSRTSFEGPAVLELRAGDAVLTIGDRQQRISSGATVHIPARVGIEITNLRGDLDVSMRATVVTEVSR